MTATALRVPDRARRADLASFVARVVQLDPAATVRLCGSVPGAGGDPIVTAWASTPFEVLATRSAPGAVAPADVAVRATALLTALAVARADTVDPGAAAPWRAELPAAGDWVTFGELPAAQLAAHVDRVVAGSPASGPSAAELDRVAVEVPDPAGPPLRVPVRCLFALSGLGLLADDPVRVSATRSWLRLDTAGGAVVRRRISTLPLLV